MAIYDKKDFVNTCKTSSRVNTGKMKKAGGQWLHLIYGIRVSYFRSGSFKLIIPYNFNAITFNLYCIAKSNILNGKQRYHDLSLNDKFA